MVEEIFDWSVEKRYVYIFVFLSNYRVFQDVNDV